MSSVKACDGKDLDCQKHLFNLSGWQTGRCSPFQNKLINWKQLFDESVTDLYKHIKLYYIFSVIFNLLLSHFIIFLRHALKSMVDWNQ